MLDHVHLLLTPSADTTLERAMQVIRGAQFHRTGAETAEKHAVVRHENHGAFKIRQRVRCGRPALEAAAVAAAASGGAV